MNLSNSSGVRLPLSCNAARTGNNKPNLVRINTKHRPNEHLTFQRCPNRCGQWHVILHLTPGCLPEICSTQVESVLEAVDVPCPNKRSKHRKNGIQRCRDILPRLLFEDGDHVVIKEVVEVCGALIDCERIEIICEIIE
jgi:hypothetical protein